ncbi:MAG: GPI inositol deacylase [Trizodia sp. TS-e1964]|nr:MAG: GPI inositol deacylase [Trizodia sp. TS-e1964]
MPFILLVETLTGGKMIPRLSKPFHLVTNMLFAFLSVYSAIYGATYAYLLHHLVNVVSLWLVTVHVSASSFSFARLRHILEGIEEEQDLKKSP